MSYAEATPAARDPAFGARTQPLLHAPFSTVARALSRWGLGRLRNLLQLRASAEQRQMIEPPPFSRTVFRELLLH